MPEPRITLPAVNFASPANSAWLPRSLVSLFPCSLPPHETINRNASPPPIPRQGKIDAPRSGCAIPHFQHRAQRLDGHRPLPRPPLRRRLQSPLQSGPSPHPESKRIILDLTDLTSVDSMELGTLVRLYVS